MSPHVPNLVPGQTCWRIEPANRFAFVVDGKDYYRAVKEAILKAEHTVMMIGWDFDTRIEFEPDAVTLDGPNTLGPFLNWISKRKPELELRILKWNLGITETLKRGETPLFVAQWLTGKRVTLKLDAAHPVAASHHQKVVVIDDPLAFCGGIDITQGRWDTREHIDGDPSRRSARGKLLPPWHDATTCFDGPAARALGDLARARWLRGTGEELTPPPLDNDIWPDGLMPTATDVDVAISRTMGAYDDFPQVSEIEKLYLAGIKNARRVLYIESQYFACRTIAEAIAERVKEEDGPEVVIINPESQAGWLEESTMGAARVKLYHLVRRADRFDRFRIYYPATKSGDPIYVHAKIMIADDSFMKVGSSNLNNRSMGFDTECDLSLEANEANAELRKVIIGIRHDLLAEHLGVPPEEVARQVEASGSLIKAIEALRAGGKRLVPLEIRELDAVDEALVESDLIDPERPPPKLWQRARRRLGLG